MDILHKLIWEQSSFRWQSIKPNGPSIDSIKSFEETIYKQTNYKKGVYTVIDGMWANVNRYRDYNLTHSHGGEWSFVYYISQTREGCK